MGGEVSGWNIVYLLTFKLFESLLLIQIDSSDWNQNQQNGGGVPDCINLNCSKWFKAVELNANPAEMDAHLALFDPKIIPMEISH